GKVVNINNWSLQIDTNLLDVTSWSTGTDQWRAYTPGLSGAAGSASGFFDAASTGQNDIRSNILTPAASTCKLEIDKAGGAAYTGSIYLSGYGVDVAIDGTADISVDFTFNGAVAYTTTTS
ncbi:MAG: phage tail tube protein, partial [Actinomycetota bacterium]